MINKEIISSAFHEEINNRIILIGNGFDLSLGNKTSYSDFLLWFLKKQILDAVRGGAKRVNGLIYNGYSNHTLLTVLMPVRYGRIDYEKELSLLITHSDIDDFCKKFEIEKKTTSNFFQRILNHSKDIGWVDIEDIYYSLLKNCLKSQELKVRDINIDLKELTKELHFYLVEVNTLKNDFTFVARSFVDQVIQPFRQEEFIDSNLVVEERNPERVYFLNFNYTNSLEKILKYPQRTHNSKFFENQIHGTLEDVNNPMIFGFGDEYDEFYKEIENTKNNDFFEHIKSFKYLNTSNYHNLLRFLEADNYQVFIYGHSCGLSDKTMLKQIFENENCKSIKIFYYRNKDGWDDFEQKTMDISRHFDDKGLMRKLIVNKEFSEAIPQHKEEDVDNKKTEAKIPEWKQYRFSLLEHKAKKYITFISSWALGLTITFIDKITSLEEAICF